jgi:hypothetical protein
VGAIVFIAEIGTNDLALREGGRGRGLDLRVEASSSVRVGRVSGFGVVGTETPFAFPRPCRRSGDGVWVAAAGIGGVDGGGEGALD